MIELFVYRVAGPSDLLIRNLDRRYFSRSMLLLRPDSMSVNAFGGTLRPGATRTQAGQLWFTNFDSVREVLNDNKFLSAIVKKLPSSSPLTVDALRMRLLAYPSSIRTTDMVDLSKLQENDSSPGSSVKDFEESQSLQLRRNALQMITLSIWDENPENSKLLAEILTDHFLQEMKRQTSREYQERRKFLQELMNRSQSQIKKLEIALGKRVGKLTKAELLDLEHELSTDLQRLEGIKASLKASLSVPAALPGEPAAPAGIEGATSQARLNQLAGANIYQPDSQIAQAAKSRLENLERLRSSMADQLQESQRGQLETVRQSQEAQVADLTTEIDELKALLGSPRNFEDARKIERALSHWQANFLSIVPQLYRARVQERQAESAGALVVVQKPIQGAPLQGSPANRPPTAALIAFLPISLGTGIIAGVLVDAFHQSRSVHAQLSKQGLPILAMVPTLPSKVSRPWQELRKSVERRERPKGGELYVGKS